MHFSYPSPNVARKQPVLAPFGGIAVMDTEQEAANRLVAEAELEKVRQLADAMDPIFEHGKKP